MSACPLCNQKCNQGRDCLANKQGHEPSRTQTKQIVDGLQRCHHPDSQHEFLRTWIRDWTIHKTAQRQLVGLTDEELKPLCDENHIMFGAYTVDFIQAIEAKLKEKNT